MWRRTQRPNEQLDETCREVLKSAHDFAAFHRTYLDFPTPFPPTTATFNLLNTLFFPLLLLEPNTPDPDVLTRPCPPNPDPTPTPGGCSPFPTIEESLTTCHGVNGL